MSSLPLPILSPLSSISLSPMNPMNPEKENQHKKESDPSKNLTADSILCSTQIMIPTDSSINNPLFVERDKYQSVIRTENENQENQENENEKNQKESIKSAMSAIGDAFVMRKEFWKMWASAGLIGLIVGTVAFLFFEGIQRSTSDWYEKKSIK